VTVGQTDGVQCVVWPPMRAGPHNNATTHVSKELYAKSYELNTIHFSGKHGVSSKRKFILCQARYQDWPPFAGVLSAAKVNSAWPSLTGGAAITGGGHAH